MGTKGEAMQAEILGIMRTVSRPLSAYDLLGELSKTKAKIAPPTVYRALSALTSRGRAHRIESLNAYVACQCSDHDNGSILSICDDCGSVEESAAPKVLSEVTSVLQASGFEAQRHVIEVHGTCSACGTEAPAK